MMLIKASRMTDRVTVALQKGYLGHSVNQVLAVRRRIRTLWQVCMCYGQ